MSTPTHITRYAIVLAEAEIVGAIEWAPYTTLNDAEKARKDIENLLREPCRIVRLEIDMHEVGERDATVC